jgi:hypothetical protein
MCAKRSQVKSTERANDNATSPSKWKQAICQAQEEIDAERKKIEQLERAIAVFQQMEANEIPWPEGSAAATRN